MKLSELRGLLEEIADRYPDLEIITLDGTQDYTKEVSVTPMTLEAGYGLEDAGEYILIS